MVALGSLCQGTEGTGRGGGNDGHAKSSKAPTGPSHLRSFSWFRQPQDQWAVVVTSSVAYSAFTRICPGACLGGQDLLPIPLWNCVLFHQLVKSRVQDSAPAAARVEAVSVLKVCKQHLRVDTRHPGSIWEALLMQIVPFQLREFVVMALWRKLPVAQRLAQFEVMEGQDCPVCGVAEDHDHVFKECFYLPGSLAPIRRLWGMHVCDNVWYEPSQLFTDHSLVSITAIQGWLVWRAVYLRWLIRREAISTLPSDIAMAVLQRFYAALLSWKSLHQGTLPQEVITTTCECLKDILTVRDKLPGVATYQGDRFGLIPLTPPPPLEAAEERQGPDRQGMRCGGDVRISQVRVWVAIAESEHGTAYGATFGTSHPYDFHVIAGVSEGGGILGGPQGPHYSPARPYSVCGLHSLVPD